MDPTQDYLWVSGTSLFTMRLLIDGAVNIYEEIDCDLAQFVRSEGHLSSHIMIETVGTALYSLQRLIHDLQERQVKEALHC